MYHHIIIIIIHTKKRHQSQERLHIHLLYWTTCIENKIHRKYIRQYQFDLWFDGSLILYFWHMKFFTSYPFGNWKRSVQSSTGAHYVHSKQVWCFQVFCVQMAEYSGLVYLQILLHKTSYDKWPHIWDQPRIELHFYLQLVGMVSYIYEQSYKWHLLD